MRVFGTISKYTLDVMGQAVMAEQFEKDRLGLLPQVFGTDTSCHMKHL